MANPDTFDVAVVGGGLVGAAIGYGLARGGMQVALLDEGDIAYRASRGNFGLVWVQGKGLGLAPYSNWTQLSARRWPELAALLRADADTDVALEQPGGFHLCLSERELETRVQALTRLIAQPGLEAYPFEVLDHAALAGRIPGIGSAVVGGTYTRLDGHVNALKLLRALHAGFGKHGGIYLPNTRTERLQSSDGRFVLEAQGITLRASKIVLAAGLGNLHLAPQVGLVAPVRPQRGQILVMERVRRFLHHPLATLRQTDEGTVLIGDSQEEAGYDDTVGLAVLATLADRALRAFPALRDVRINRTWAALRVMSPDGFPVYEQSRAQPGAFLATCHSGVTLAAAHALELAPLIAAGDLGPRLQPFSAERLHVQKAA
ncbi:MAG: FAD-binding oxidoreductase [Burkholderiales bacterium]|nr:FAD-binding oxidoreductase [Burkholderiales bacterium]